MAQQSSRPKKERARKASSRLEKEIKHLRARQGSWPKKKKKRAPGLKTKENSLGLKKAHSLKKGKIEKASSGLENETK